MAALAALAAGLFYMLLTGAHVPIVRSFAMACLFTLAVLAGRRAFGWRGPLATRWLYGGAALLLLAYVGSRFVLEIVLQRAPG